jgi:hypothetical protein
MATDAPDILDLIRRRTAEVADSSHHVRLRADQITRYAADLHGQGAAPDPGDPAHESVTRDTETQCLFVLALDAVNFGSGWFPVLAKRSGLSGYHTIATSLAERVRRDGLTLADLRSCDRTGMADTMGQDAEGPISDLLDHFVESWRLLADLVEGEGGTAIGWVRKARGSAARLVDALVSAHPMYADMPDHNGTPVPLLKRAQITAADLHLTFGHEGPGSFHDLHRLTMFADNLVPHVLRLDGVLDFSPQLVTRLDRGELLEPGEPAEVEIRAVAVHAVELLVAELAPTDRPLDAMTIDGMLWHRGAGARYKSRPRHRCRTTAY